MNPSPKALQQMFRLSTDALFPALLKITYVEDSTTKYLYLVNNGEDLIYNAQTYTASSFKYTPPAYSDKKIGDGEISISCIDQSLIGIIRNIQERATAQIIAAFYYQDGALLFEPIEEWNFELSNVTWNGAVATWKMEYDNRMSLKVPADTLTPQKCPGVA
jgi:hypothetical protein